MNDLSPPPGDRSWGRTALFLAFVVSGIFVALRAVLVDGPPIEMSLLSTFSCFGYASVGCAYALRADAGGRQRLAIGTVASLAVLSAALAWIDAATLFNIAKAFLAALGVAGAIAYVRDVRAAQPGLERHARLATLRDALIAPLATAQVTYFLWPSTQLNPVYDLYIYDFETILGLVPEPAIAAVYQQFYPWSHVATACYLALPIGLSLVALHQPGSERVTRVLLAAAVTGAAGFLLYQLCPVVGPVQSLERVFDVALADLPSMSAHPIDAPGRVPRNGMPSLHGVWAFLILLNTRWLPPGWRTVAVVFAALNFVASMGRYQHWYMDHTVAVPMAAAIQLAVVGHPGSRPFDRWVLAAASAIIVGAWLVGLRFGWLTSTPAWLAWCAVGVTIALPCWGVRPRRVSREARLPRPDTASVQG